MLLDPMYICRHLEDIDDKLAANTKELRLNDVDINEQLEDVRKQLEQQVEAQKMLSRKLARTHEDTQKRVAEPTTSINFNDSSDVLSSAESLDSHSSGFVFKKTHQRRHVSTDITSIH